MATSMAAPVPIVQTRMPVVGDSFPCGTCGLLFEGRADLVSHYKGDLHRANLQRKVEGLEPLSHEEFEERAAALAEAPQDKADARTQRQEARLEQQLQGGGSKTPQGHAPLQLERTQCIFSRKKFDSVEAAVEHMKKKFGFFIPDSECLTDLYGLMDFLREQVVTHHCCWFCGRVGRSYEATVQHMVDKSHCKLPYEGSHPDLAPYFAFGEGNESAEWVQVGGADATADVGDTELCRPVAAPYCAAAEAAAAKAERLQKLAPPPVVGPPAAGEEEQREGDEGSWEQVDGSSSAEEPTEELPMPQTAGPTALVLADGRVLGHRSMQRYYRQAPRPARPQSDEADDEEGRLADGEDPAAAATAVGEDGDDAFSSLELQEGTHRSAGRRVVAAADKDAGPPPVDKEARRQQTKGEVQRDRQQYKAGVARSKIAGGRGAMWQQGL